ncbi:MAG: esterase [Deltaproteobacteria bacterium]|jgi:phospholipase/carboxylesterase|nr:esterase [Deltaproteobacteria bacterium]
MSNLKLGGVDARVVGNLDDGGLVVVLLHGFGAPGTDLVPLGEFIECPPSTCFVFPEAPLTPPMLMGGRAWWMLDIQELEEAMASGKPRDRSGSVPEGSEEPRKLMTAFLAELIEEHGVEPKRIVLGGFSQGSMVATDVLLRSDWEFAGLIIWSGTLLAKNEWVPLMAKRKGLRVVQSHGEADPLLPYELAEKLRDHLREGGLMVDWVNFAGGHEIPPQVLDHTSALLAKLSSELKRSG